MDTASQIAPAASSATAKPIGQVTSISGGQAKVTLVPSTDLRAGDQYATVGRFLGIQTSGAVIIGLISAVAQDDGHGDAGSRSVARVELIGEIREVAGVPQFQRGIEAYPKIGDAAVFVTERELRIVYGTVDADRAHIGDLQQSTDIGVHINIDDLVSRLNDGEGTAGQLLKDKQLYENMNGAVNDFRKLLTAVSSDPKKYLNVRVSIF